MKHLILALLLAPVLAFGAPARITGDFINQKGQSVLPTPSSTYYTIGVDSDDGLLKVVNSSATVKVCTYSGDIVNADIAAGAAIAFSKLAALTSGNLLVGSAGNVATSVAMSGDVAIVASGATTIQNGAVSNAKLADMAQSTIKGRAASSGTGAPVDLSATQATAILDNMVGDSGSGGTKGLVPAPAAGDAAGSKYLDAAGNWSVPAGSGGGSVFWGGIHYATDTSGNDCLFQSINQSAFANVGAQANCDAPTLYKSGDDPGGVTLNAAKILGADFAVIDAGFYMAILQGTVYMDPSNSSACAARFSDGTVHSTASAFAGNNQTGQDYNSGFIGFMYYATGQTNKTIRLQSMDLFGDANCNFAARNTGEELSFMLIKLF